MRELVSDVRIPSEVEHILAEVIADAVAGGRFISPRTAMHARQIVQAAAAIRDADVAVKEDITAIRYLQGCGEIAAGLSQEIDAAAARANATRELEQMERRVAALAEEFDSAPSPIKALQVHKRAGRLADALAAMRLPDGFIDRREALRRRLGQLTTDATARAVELTRVED
jgi:hypothetical protein